MIRGTLEGIAAPGEWYNQALCAKVDPEIFFPAGGNAISVAMRVCDQCPVIAECRDYALTHDVVGVWGGMSEIRLVRLRRAKRNGGEIRACETCGTAYAPRDKGSRLCSKTCSNRGQRKRVAITCAVCRNTFQTQPAAARRFCSQSCAAKAQWAKERAS